MGDMADWMFEQTLNPYEEDEIGCRDCGEMECKCEEGKDD